MKDISHKQLLEAVGGMFAQIVDSMATKADLKQTEAKLTALMATKEDLKQTEAKLTALMATKEDTKDMRNEMKGLATKADLNSTEVRLTRRIDKIDRKFDSLREGLAHAARSI